MWLAVYLKRRAKCRISPPLWLNSEYLADKLAEEKAIKEQFSELHFYFEEISSLILKKYIKEGFLKY